MLFHQKYAPWTIIDNVSAEEFILLMLKFGKPLQTSLVGNFDIKGRGSRRDIDLPFHRDGDYSHVDGKIDIVGLYCIKEGTTQTFIKHDSHTENFCLKKRQMLIFDNNTCLHARKGSIKDRLLLRIWIEKF